MYCIVTCISLTFKMYEINFLILSLSVFAVLIVQNAQPIISELMLHTAVVTVNNRYGEVSGVMMMMMVEILDPLILLAMLINLLRFFTF